MDKPSRTFTISWLGRDGDKKSVSVNGDDEFVATLLARSEAMLHGWNGDIRRDGSWK